MVRKGLVTSMTAVIALGMLSTGCSRKTDELRVDAKAGESVTDTISASVLAENTISAESIRNEEASEKETISEEKLTEDSTDSHRSDTDLNWKEAYISFINDNYDSNEDTEYTLIYLDADDIPELFIRNSCEADGELVATYFKGRVVSKELSRIGSQYIENEGLIYTDTGHTDLYPVTVTQLKNGKFTNIAAGKKFVSEEDLKKMNEDENYPYTLTYQWGGKIVTEDEFRDKLAAVYDLKKSIYPEYLISYDQMIEKLEKK